MLGASALFRCADFSCASSRKDRNATPSRAHNPATAFGGDPLANSQLRAAQKVHRKILLQSVGSRRYRALGLLVKRTPCEDRVGPLHCR